MRLLSSCPWSHRRGGWQRPSHRRVTVLLQAQGEATASAGLARDLDRAAEQPRVFLRDREPQAGAAPTAGRVVLVEALKEVLQLLWRDPRPVVCDLDERARVLAADAHVGMVSAVLERVADQVRKDPLDAARV